MEAVYEKKAKKGGNYFLFLLGVILIICAPYFPDSIFYAIYGYDQYPSLLNGDTRFAEIRFVNVIPSIRMCGVVLSAWGIVLLCKSDRKG